MNGSNEQLVQNEHHSPNEHQPNPNGCLNLLVPVHQPQAAANFEADDWEMISEDGQVDQICPAYERGSVELTLKDKAAKKIMGHRKKFNITERASVEMADDWRKFFEELVLANGKFRLK